MEKGEIRFHGPTAELLERPDVLRSVFLEGAAAGATPVADGTGRGGGHARAVAGRPAVPATATATAAARTARRRSRSSA